MGLDPIVEQIKDSGHNGLYPHVSSYELPPIENTDTGEVCKPWKDVSNSDSHPMHSMMARAGSFPATLVRYFLVGYSEQGALILDPFCGKGTTVLESILLGRTAIGSDVAPDAVIVSQARITPVTIDEIESYLDSLLVQNQPVGDVSDDVKVFYHEETLAELLGVRDCLVGDASADDPAKARPAKFLMGCLLGILHGHATYSLSLSCSHTYAMAPNYVRRYAEEHNLEKPVQDVRQCLLEKSKALLEKGPVPENGSRVYESGADSYVFDKEQKLSNQVDLIITSPPYFAAQTYAKDAWLRLWLLGYDFRELRSRYIKTQSIERYKRQMKPCIAEMLRVLKPVSSAFVVAGDVFLTRKGRKRLVRTAEILAGVAESIDPVDGFGFEVVQIIDDSIPTSKRYYASVHKDNNDAWHYEEGGTGVRIDRILHLRKVPQIMRK